MTLHAQHIAKYVVYSLGLVATIATSPAYTFHGVTGSDVETIEITEASEFISLTASAITTDDSAESMTFSSCAWEPVAEFASAIPQHSEVFIWKVDDEWSQEAFDEAYAEALSEFEPEEDPEAEDTGSFDTGTDAILSDGTEVHLTTVEDHRFSLNPEHDVFYDVMSTFTTSIGYRIFEDGELFPYFYPDDMILFADMNFPFETECDDQNATFVITVLGEPTTTSLDIDMLRHEGVTIASDTLACGMDKGPDYSDVTIDVELSIEE